MTFIIILFSISARSNSCSLITVWYESQRIRRAPHDCNSVPHFVGLMCPNYQSQNQLEYRQQNEELLPVFVERFSKSFLLKMLHFWVPWLISSFLLLSICVMHFSGDCCQYFFFHLINFVGLPIFASSFFVACPWCSKNTYQLGCNCIYRDSISWDEFSSRSC